MMKKHFGNRIIVMLSICVLILSLFGGCGKKTPTIVIGGNGTGLPPVSSGNAKNNEEEKKELPTLFVFEGINEEMHLINFLKIGKSSRKYVFNYSGRSAFISRYGSYMTVHDLIPGDVVELKVKESEQLVLECKISADVFRYDDVEEFSIDPDKDMLVVFGEKYYIPENTPVYKGDEVIDRTRLTGNEMITVYGYEKTIYSVQITTGHGVLAFTNTTEFEGGYYVLGNLMAGEITKDLRFNVRCGTYTLLVAHNEQSGSVEVTIEENKVTFVNLQKFVNNEIKRCTITFLVSDPNAKLMINGQVVDYSKAISLKYGMYRIVCTCDGYEEWSRLLFVNSKTAYIDINLEKIVDNNTDDDDNGDDDNGDDDNGDDDNGDDDNGDDDNGDDDNGDDDDDNGDDDDDDNGGEDNNDDDNEEDNNND
ncbi:MAG: hypothetical protein II147_07605 [Lachnospiraceae bacterium]|nr:hypothetical protein [Lachnospiraceae bacterium]